MAKLATKNRLGARLAVCQFVGTVVGLLVAEVIGQLIQPVSNWITGSYLGDLEMVAAFALVINIPFYAAAVLVLHSFTKSILTRPLIWCVAVPGILLVMALCAFPPLEYQGILWIALILLCALIAGLAFVGWQTTKPLVYDG